MAEGQRPPRRGNRHASQHYASRVYHYASDALPNSDDANDNTAWLLHILWEQTSGAFANAKAGHRRNSPKWPSWIAPTSAASSAGSGILRCESFNGSLTRWKSRLRTYWRNRTRHGTITTGIAPHGSSHPAQCASLIDALPLRLAGCIVSKGGERDWHSTNLAHFLHSHRLGCHASAWPRCWTPRQVRWLFHRATSPTKGRPKERMGGIG